ncbi:MAG: glycosyltransferase family 10 [Kiritimatiellaeota bacterium]|nr:glycosyltransferase family 10 [Kiritimatiellota bacterium]
MKTLRLWYDSDATRHLMRILCARVASRFTCHETPRDPDFFFFSGLRRRELLQPGLRVFVTGENMIPDFNTADFALAFAPIEFPGRYLRWPLFRLYGEAYALARDRPALDAPPDRAGFCACVVSNTKNRQDPLAETADALASHLPLSYGGRWRNSTNGPVEDKMEFLRGHRFAIAFENTAAPGYTTEKILEAFAARVIPIYWGNPEIAADFNPAAFVNAADFESPAALARHVAALDRDPAQRLAMLNAPVFPGGVEPLRLRDDVLADFLTRMFETPPGQLQRSTGRWPQKYEASLRTAFFHPFRHAARRWAGKA